MSEQRRWRLARTSALLALAGVAFYFGGVDWYATACLWASLAIVLWAYLSPDRD